MNAEQKRRTARILGYICILAGALNLTLTVVKAIQEQTLEGSPLLITGIVALSMGVFMLALGRQKPPSGG